MAMCNRFPIMLAPFKNTLLPGRAGRAHIGLGLGKTCRQR